MLSPCPVVRSFLTRVFRSQLIDLAGEAKVQEYVRAHADDLKQRFPHTRNHLEASAIIAFALAPVLTFRWIDRADARRFVVERSAAGRVQAERRRGRCAALHQHGTDAPRRVSH